METIIGVDMSAYWFDVTCDGQSVKHINNETAAIEQWLQTVPLPARLAIEATATYHLLLANLASAAGLEVFILNPRLVHHYAKGVGRRAKSDKVDAKIIRRYLMNECQNQSPWQPPTESQARISQLIKRRASYVSQRQALKMSSKGLEPYCKTLSPALKALQDLIDELEKLIIDIIRSDESGRHMMEKLRSIPGVGPLTAAFMYNLFTQHAFKSMDQLVSFLGMDLIYADSGKRKSKRKLSKHGSSEARRLLFNGARAASQGVLKPIYEHYRERMNHTRATVAMMRKLLKIIMGVWKTKTAFSIEKFDSPLLKMT